MRRGAEVVAEDRVLAVLAVARVAACRRRAAGTGRPSRQYQQRVDWSRLPPTVPIVAELRRRGEPARLAQRVRDLGARLELGQRRRRADPGAVDPARQRGPRRSTSVSVVEQSVAQQRHDLGAAGEEDRVAAQVERRRG